TYRLLTAAAAKEGGAVRGGDRFLVAEELRASVEREAGFTADEHSILRLKGTDLAGTVAAHPLRGQGYEFDVPLLPGGFVTTDQGTGLVHTAPGHGADDWELGRAHGIEVPQTVDEDGRYFPHVPLFAGRRVLTPQGEAGDADIAVMDALAAAGALLSRGRLTHSYPHSWRSKAPLIFRNTPQWFISMETNGLRQNALQAIADTEWVPPAGENRIRSMIESRPDWCSSRRPAWCGPIAASTEKA